MAIMPDISDVVTEAEPDSAAEAVEVAMSISISKAEEIPGSISISEFGWRFWKVRRGR